MAFPQRPRDFAEIALDDARRAAALACRVTESAQAVRDGLVLESLTHPEMGDMGNPCTWYLAMLENK